MAGTLEGKDAGKMNSFTVVDGISVSWACPPSTLEALKKFEVRNDDVFIVTYPKSGTHWLMEIVYLIQANGDVDKVKRYMMDQGLEFTMCRGPSEVPKTKPGYKYMEEWESPRVMMTHLMHRFLPPQIGEKKAKVIYLARNPKDTATSMHHFMYNLMPEGAREWDVFIKTFQSKEMIGGDWFTHVYNYWTKCKDADNVLFLKYEQLKKNHRGTVKQVAEFLGKDLSDDVIDKITSLSTFEGMRKTYDKLEAEPGGNMRTRAWGVLPFLNKGKVGTWKEKLSDEQSKWFDDKVVEVFKDTGFTLEYEV